MYIYIYIIYIYKGLAQGYENFLFFLVNEKIDRVREHIYLLINIYI